MLCIALMLLPSWMWCKGERLLPTIDAAVDDLQISKIGQKPQGCHKPPANFHSAAFQIMRQKQSLRLLLILCTSLFAVAKLDVAQRQEIATYH